MRKRIKRRAVIINRLGDKCQCCNLNNTDLLSIDHICGGGHKEAQEMSWKKYMRMLYNMPQEGLLAKYRCLCFNCNYTRGFWGVCPHQLSTEPIPQEILLIGNKACKTNLTGDEYKNRRYNLDKIATIKARLEMIQAYGGHCINCQENHPLFLVIDHINNNGNLETHKKGTEFYQYLKRLGYPGKETQLQLLCHNCNAKKEYIDNRKNKEIDIKLSPEEYIAQPYSTPNEQELWHEARVLFARIQMAKTNSI